jgi:hypothetical protein
MADRRLVLIASPADAPAANDATPAVVVLDTAWTPQPGDRADLVPVRPLIGDVLRDRDLFLESYERLEQWATAAGIPDRLTVDGVSWWYRRRQRNWLRLHELLLWRAVLDAVLDRFAPISTIDMRTDLTPLAEVARLVAARDGRTFVEPGLAAPHSAGRASIAGDGLLGRLLGAPARRARRREVQARLARLAGRAERLSADPRPRFLFLTNPSTHQVVGGSSGDRRVDPFFGTVIDDLAAGGVGAISLDLRVNPSDDEGWAALEGNEDRLPATMLAGRWAAASDRGSSASKAAAAAQALEAAPPAPLVDGRIDLGPLLMGDLRRFASDGLAARLRETARAGRALRELRPAGVVLYNEYGRTEWLAAARSAGIPAFAVQHGIIYPWHLGYRRPRDAAIPIPVRTFVFGDYERRVLLDCGGYLLDEVDVAGAPRLDLIPIASVDDRAGERAAVRRDLGVAAGNRLLVISTTFERLHRRYYLVHALAALLDAPLPNVHLVFKQHPAETDEGPYRALVEGLAVAGGWAAPPITVVRDIDLYRLLRAADAHLGLFSTVLTDAVAAGTPNLVATTQAHRDLLGYVDAGVARPVSTPADLLAALDVPAPVDKAARARFLADHFRPGNASRRIATAIATVAGSQATVPVASMPSPA